MCEEDEKVKVCNVNAMDGDGEVEFWNGKELNSAMNVGAMFVFGDCPEYLTICHNPLTSNATEISFNTYMELYQNYDAARGDLIGRCPDLSKIVICKNAWEPRR